MPNEHHVCQGECVNSLAKMLGFFPDTIWNHSDNCELKELRKDPNVLQEGDILVIPDKQPHAEQCAVEKNHKFKRKGIPAIFKLTLMKDGEPRANLAYTLDIDGKVLTGSTDSAGKLEHPIPPDARLGVLTIEQTGEVHRLNLGSLDPHDTVIGAKQRLQGLGYYKGAIDPEQGEEFQDSVRAFQSDRDMEVTGEHDDKVKSKLKSIFGS